MQVDIITPEQIIFSAQSKLVQLPGSGGSFEILENHAPMVSTLEKGKIKIISQQGEETFFDIQSGVVEVLKNKVIVLAQK